MEDDRPSLGNNKPSLRLKPPSPEDFYHYYSQLSQKYSAILVLPMSSMLGLSMESALAASAQFTNHCEVQVIDSTDGRHRPGAARPGGRGHRPPRGSGFLTSNSKVRVAIPHVYSLICIPELMYLANAGHMDRSQAMVGEIMSMLPIFTLEDGRLTPSEKVRTPRHLFEAFQDFMAEFESPAHIALVHGPNHNNLRIRPLRQYMQELFPHTPFSEHSLPPHLTALFGPQSIGLFVSEI